MKLPKVSVIIPYYNNSKTILRAINSVLNQTYKNIEIILINDASTEDISFMKEIIKKNNIIYSLNKKNLGPSATRNRGIDLSKGVYLAFLDSDDEYLSNKIEVQVKFMEENKCMFSHTSYYRIENNKKNLILTALDFPNFSSKLLYNCTIATPTIMLKRDLIVKNNIKYTENFRYAEDVCFYLEICKYTDFKGINIPLTNVYIDNESSINNTKNQLVGLKNIITYIKTQDYKKNYISEYAKLIINYVKLYIKYKIKLNIKKLIK